MPFPIQSVAVFCGARTGADPAHAAAARELGSALAEAGMTLIYGGGGLGLMGEVARAAVEAGGRVRGVIPEFLTRIERPYDALTELEVTGSMHTRKTRMYELADAFVTLSGGLGTLDETVEVLTWRQLDLHDKPIIVLEERGVFSAFARSWRLTSGMPFWRILGIRLLTSLLVGIAAKTISNYANHLTGAPLDAFMANTAWVAPSRRAAAAA